jgi:dTDP-4-amino-4,6-dideoxygalactose transaminase
MMKAIPRFGARVPPEAQAIVAACRKRGELVRGPQIEEFEQAFADRLGTARGVATSYGRMAFYYILKAYAFPPGSEIILPALTFWVIPEMAKVAGLKVVFADVDPATSTISPGSIERAITPRTVAVVPTHLYGLPCEMEAIVSVAARHGIIVIEDCAHALGATYRGAQVGTLGSAALFSFQTLKPLATFRGGMAIVHDRVVRDRVRRLADTEPWPRQRDVLHRLALAWLQTTFMRPGVFTYFGFPVLWAGSWWGGRPDVYLWEQVRHLDPLPASYNERYSNVQAALGLAGLKHLDEWTASTRRHAHLLNRALSAYAQIPYVPPDCHHVYYQYSFYVPDHTDFVRRALRRGIDVEMLHMDVCTRLPLFADSAADAPGADRAAEAVQLPVYASLSDVDVARVARTTRAILREARGATGRHQPTASGNGRADRRAHGRRTRPVTAATPPDTRRRRRVRPGPGSSASHTGVSG